MKRRLAAIPVFVIALAGMLGVGAAHTAAFAEPTPPAGPAPPPPPPVILPDPIAIANQLYYEIMHGDQLCATVQFQVGPVGNGSGDNICVGLAINP